MEIIQATRKETAALIKKYLKQKYGIKASVSSKVYSGGSSLSVDYVLGPSSELIDKEFSRLEYGRFNGMDDSYNFKKDAETGFVVDGKRLCEYSYLFVNQYIPKSIFFQLAVLFSDYYRFEEAHQVLTLEDLSKNFIKPISSHWNWTQYIYAHLKNRNFMTQDETKIKITELVPGEFSWEMSFNYTVDNTVYNSNTFQVKETSMRKMSRPVLNKVRLVEYDSSKVALTGDTFELKEQLEKIVGGIPSKDLVIDGKVTKGWVFPKSRESELANILIDYAYED